MKKWIITGICALVVAAGCAIGLVYWLGDKNNDGDSSTPDTSSTSSQQSSTPDTSGVSSQTDNGDEDDDEKTYVVNTVNDVLAKYASGAYPEEIIYESEPGVLATPPKGVSLPKTVQWEDLQITYPNSGEMSMVFGADAYEVQAVLALQDDFSMNIHLWVPTEEKDREYSSYGIRFVDGKPAQTAGEVEPEKGMIFRELTADRITLEASFSGFYLGEEGVELSGTITWDMPSGLVHVGGLNNDLSDIYYRVSGDTATVEFPRGLDLSEAVPYRDGDVSILAQEIHDGLLLACNSVGISL